MHAYYMAYQEVPGVLMIVEWLPADHIVAGSNQRSLRFLQSGNDGGMRGDHTIVPQDGERQLLRLPISFCYRLVPWHLEHVGVHQPGLGPENSLTEKSEIASRSRQRSNAAPDGFSSRG